MARSRKLNAKLRSENRAVESDLRDALTAEKVVYTDAQTYVASASTMKTIEPTLDWGRRLHVTVVDAVARGDRGVVCLSETSPTGATYAVADVALGPGSGTYYGPKPCPAPLTAKGVARLGTSFDATN